MSAKKSFSEIEYIFSSFGYVLMSDKYISVKHKLDFADSEGYKFNLSLDSFLACIRFGSRPERFSSYNIHTMKNIAKWLAKNSSLELIGGHFENALKKTILVKCSDCDKEYLTRWNDLQSGKGCSDCSHKKSGLKRRLKKDYVNKIIESMNFRIISGEYSGYGSTMTLECLSCGYIHKTKFSAFRTLKGCIKCSSSRGEIAIAEFLEDMNIEYIKEKSFDGCKYKKKLRFDFYLPSENLLIEYNGEQHYRPVEHFKGSKNFKDVVKRDEVKEKFCKENNIKLLVIPFWDYDNIGQILSKTIGG